MGVCSLQFEQIPSRELQLRPSSLISVPQEWPWLTLIRVWQEKA